MREEGASLASDTMLDNQQLVFTEGQRPIHIHMCQSARNPLYNGDIQKVDYTHLTKDMFLVLGCRIAVAFLLMLQHISQHCLLIISWCSAYPYQECKVKSI